MPLPHSVQAHKAPLSKRRHDCYDTDPVAVHALRKCETLPYRVWEPACGKGNIVNVLRAAGHHVVATDLNDRGCPSSISSVDFLLPVPEAYLCPAILTNPPYALAEKFVDMALRRAKLVIMLLRLAFLEGGAGRTLKSKLRRELLDGGKLARVHVFANRLPMMHRDGWDGNKASSGMTFAWFVWNADHKGPTIIDRIWWEPLIPENDAAADPSTWLGPQERIAAEVKAQKLVPDYGPLFSSIRDPSLEK